MPNQRDRRRCHCPRATSRDPSPSVGAQDRYGGRGPQSTAEQLLACGGREVRSAVKRRDVVVRLPAARSRCRRQAGPGQTQRRCRTKGDAAREGERQGLADGPTTCVARQRRLGLWQAVRRPDQRRQAGGEKHREELAPGTPALAAWICVAHGWNNVFPRGGWVTVDAVRVARTSHGEGAMTIRIAAIKLSHG
jgi:hypothetical protein